MSRKSKPSSQVPTRVSQTLEPPNPRVNLRSSTKNTKHNKKKPKKYPQTQGTQHQKNRFQRPRFQSIPANILHRPTPTKNPPTHFPVRTTRPGLQSHRPSIHPSIRPPLRNLLVAVRTDAGGLVVLGAIIVRAVVEGAVPLPHRPPPPLVHEVPVEARERPMLGALALHEQRALLHAELLQVSAMGVHVIPLRSRPGDDPRVVSRSARLSR